MLQSRGALRRPGGRLRVGVVSDIHANLAALERALAVLAAHGADKIVCLGDVVEKGPDGDAVVACLEDRCVVTVAGNHDHNALRHAALPEALRADAEVPLRAETLERLARYPLTREYCWEDTWIHMAHGSPQDNTLYVFPEEVPRPLKRQLRDCGADVLLLGHTHRPMRVRYQGLWLLNPGSVAVGRRRDSHTCGLLSLPDLGWTILDIESGRVERQWQGTEPP